MSNVTLTIGGRQYTVACGTGEEAHIERLGQTIDGKLSTLPNLAGQSEARTLLFAALLLADEVHEARGGATAAAASESESGATADALEALAQRLEELAERLESAA